MPATPAFVNLSVNFVRQDRPSRRPLAPAVGLGMAPTRLLAARLEHRRRRRDPHNRVRIL